MNAAAPAPIDLVCPRAERLTLRIRELVSRLLGRGIRYSGGYPDWQAATAACLEGGYATPDILERVAAATARVVRGEAAYERDSVAFAKHRYRWPLLAAMLRAALEDDSGHLVVLDFGGALGSSYHQCRPFLPRTLDVQWFIVEQEHFVARGRKEFETEHLHFFRSTSEACARARPNIAVLSSVLQYIEKPQDVLQEVGRSNIAYLLIDRVPLSAADGDAFTVQHVPAAIYRAKYPCRVFSRRRLLRLLEKDWKTIAEFPSEDGWAIASGMYFGYGGLLLQRRVRS